MIRYVDKYNGTLVHLTVFILDYMICYAKLFLHRLKKYIFNENSSMVSHVILVSKYTLWLVILGVYAAVGPDKALLLRKPNLYNGNLFILPLQSEDQK